MRCVSWNIRAGGGVRATGIAEAILGWKPDVVALSEFRDTPPSQMIRQLLKQGGLYHQRSTIDSTQPAVNALLVASKWPLHVCRLKRAPESPRRWLHVNVDAPAPFSVMAVHIPNRSSGSKYPYMDAVLDALSHWRGRPGLLMGDTNSGQIYIDEESPAFNKTEHQWMSALAKLGWADAFRLRHPDKREFTWYSPNGRNGFRLDQAFLHPDIAKQLIGFSHSWAGATPARREALSDHAAMIIDWREIEKGRSR